MLFLGFLLMDLVLIALLDAAVVRPIARKLRSSTGSRRLGLLPGAAVPTAEAARVARLRQLGKDGTYTVHNCGEILHVDYERGMLTVAREARHYR